MDNLQKAIETVRDMLDVVDSHGSCYVYKHNGGDARLRNVLGCLKAQQERENPKPLTLDELRQMDGEPVWCVDGSGNETWGLVSKCGHLDVPDVIDPESGNWCGNFYNMTGDGKKGLHPIGWLAYRHKPKEV